IEATEDAARQWPERAESPLVSIYPLGRGEVWLVHFPNFVKNSTLFKGIQGDNDNAQGLYRLTTAMGEASHQTLYVDEYFHGMRERPSVVDLLLQPPVLWTTLHGLGLLILALWAFTPRFGRLQETERVRRRSKEEYLNALAGILEQKRAYEHAYHSV